ncbi:MAG: hypothetical protein CM15mP66_04300 [Pseudomonadota bacterium]|nr:MAG: hypothetical protein CM15mP66_04300 [Pseudomonadota bacterium]
MSYNEYWQVIDAGLSPADLGVFKYDGEGVAVLEMVCMSWKTVSMMRIS